jgi:VanZ family protein
LANKLKILKHQLPTFAWAIFILVLCTSNSGGFITQKFFGIHTDKLGHAFIFAVLVYFLMLGFIKQWRFSFLLNKIRLISLIIAIIYAIVIELIQHYLTVDRIADYWDVAADIIGAFIGLALFHSVYGDLKFLDRDEML